MSPLRRFSPTVRLLLATLSFCVLFSALAAPLAAAQTTSGLTVSSSTVYTPDLAGEKIDVVSTYTMTNVQADEVIGDSVRSFFFTKWVIAVPATVRDFVATSSGSSLTTSLDADTESDDVAFATITLPFNLNFQQSVTLDVSYTIPGGEPRADGAVARVNDSFLSFSVWAFGDPGNTDVRVYVPDGFTLNLQGDLDELRRVDGERYYEAIGVPDPRAFFGQVFGRNDQGLLTQVAELPDAVATVRAWPDDPDWADFVVDAIENDVPIIEELTGIDWPAGDIEVIETVTPYLYGYGGWFNATSGLIEVGENLERDLILHELSHAWFNDELVDGRWITEGLAEEMASRTIEASGDPRPDPDEPNLADPLRVPLAEWASPWTLQEEDAFEYERFHYNASWWVMRQITDDVGLDAFSDVLVALNEDRLAYPGAGPPEQTNLSTRWIHFYDLLEFEADASGLDELFTTYVLSADDAAKLDTRRETLMAYQELHDQSGSWIAPPLVRRALSAWQFDDAQEHIDDALEVLGLRDEVDQLASELLVTIDHQSQMIYEIANTTPDLALATEGEAALLAELKLLEQARVDLGARAAAAGVLVSFTAQGLDEAFGDVADQRDALENVDTLVARANSEAAALDLDMPAWPMEAGISGSTDFVAVAALAEARLATLAAIDAATETVAAERSFTQHIGLWRSNPAGQVNVARQAFAADDLDDALTATATTESMIANAARTGRTRLIWTGVIIAVALLATIAIRLRRPRRALPAQELMA